MEEVVSASDRETLGWQSLYSAYDCVNHHSYAQASRWLMYGLKQGAGSQELRASTDLAYLSNGLSTVAAKRREAPVLESSCDAQVLQSLIQCVVGDKSEAVDTLKKVVLNNPTCPSLKYIETKIRDMEFEMSGDPWLIPTDVAQTGGKSDRFSNWTMNKFPLKVYIPTDSDASKIAGYRPGDGQLLRSAFETWQKQSDGKITFENEPVRDLADITCAWVSDQKDLQSSDAIGTCSRVADTRNHICHAEIKVLTFSIGGPRELDNHFRRNLLEEVCLHEIGHSLGLNHSTNENDVMSPNAHWKPIPTPTKRDVAALNSLYLTSAYA